MSLINKSPVITLDGPSGTGKGTLCHLLAAELGWHVLDSGSIYRVLAYALRKKEIHWDETSKMVALAHQLDLCFEVNSKKESQVFLEKENVTQVIRLEQCGQDASKIAAIPEIRAALLARQRAFAQPPGLVTDGRDMGTVVFPEAFLKIYLYASPEERVSRRYLQLKEQGIEINILDVTEELAQRDARDMARQSAPLKPANDAIMIDTTGLSIVQVFNNVLECVARLLSSEKGKA